MLQIYNNLYNVFWKKLVERYIKYKNSKEKIKPNVNLKNRQIKENTNGGE